MFDLEAAILNQPMYLKTDQDPSDPYKYGNWEWVASILCVIRILWHMNNHTYTIM